MRPSIIRLYPLLSSLIALCVAQILKPILFFLIKHEWHHRLAISSGGFPSSHTALVTSLAMAVGLQDHFTSTLFAVSTVLALIVTYDAANVRYYSGQNIKITQQLLKDVQESLHVRFLDPIYQTKVKEVLGHKWFECFGGIVVGIITAWLLYPG